MKKITNTILTVCLLLAFSPFESGATMATDPISLNTRIPAEPGHATQVMLDRLATIESLDKSEMRAREKRALRKEVRSIKKGLGQINGGGVYISVSLLLLIIILLILLL